MYNRTPENQPKCIIPSLGKILRSEGYVCANPGKFGVISDKMYMSNLGTAVWFQSICQSCSIKMKSGVESSKSYKSHLTVDQLCRYCYIYDISCQGTHFDAQ